MTLELDTRQRAMLQEMGVRVWQPLPAPVDSPAGASDTRPASARVQPRAQEPARPETLRSPDAIVSIAAGARVLDAAAGLSTQTTAAAQPRRAAADASQVPWSVGAAIRLYADIVKPAGPCWLVLAETPAMALQASSFDPFAGDSGKLLDNMLRAARLHLAGTALLAPLARHAPAQAAASLAAELPDLLARIQPDVILVMGRLAAQALLQSTEPFGRLRGQVHQLHGRKTVVTHDAAYLLRAPADKAKAWDDLCLAISVGPAAAP